MAAQINAGAKVSRATTDRTDAPSGVHKAAILLAWLGPDASAKVFKYLREEEIEVLTLSIANLRGVSVDQRGQVVDEFAELASAHDYILHGGIDYARAMLEKGVGSDRAQLIIERLTNSLLPRPFDFARKTDPAQLFNFIQHEHPQTIALVLAHLQSEQAAAILSALPPELQVDVAYRLATLDRTSPEVLEQVESALEQRLSAFATQDFTAAGGVEVAVAVLNRVDRGTEKTIMETLEEEYPELAEEIKKRMFVFEDIIKLDPRSVRQVIAEVDTNDWVLALKTASEDVKQLIYSNMSKRAVQMLEEDAEYQGPVRLRDVEDAQQRVVTVIRRLEESGQIVIARGGEDQMVE